MGSAEKRRLRRFGRHGLLDGPTAAARTALSRKCAAVTAEKGPSAQVKALETQALLLFAAPLQASGLQNRVAHRIRGDMTRRESSHAPKKLWKA